MSSRSLPEPPGAGLGDPLPPPPVPAIQTPLGPAYATFWRRFAARFLDGLLVGIPTIVVLVSMLSDLDPDTGITVAQRDRLFSVGLVTLAISAVYEISLVALRGQTVGKMALGINKMALGIKVVPAEGSGSVGWGRSAIRWLVPNAVGRLPGVGLIAAARGLAVDAVGSHAAGTARQGRPHRGDQAPLSPQRIRRVRPGPSRPGRGPPSAG
jgi:hypothetical protein